MQARALYLSQPGHLPSASTPSILRLPSRRHSSSDWLSQERPSNGDDVFWRAVGPRAEEVVRNPRRPEREDGSARCVAWAAWPQTLVVITA